MVGNFCALGLFALVSFSCKSTGVEAVTNVNTGISQDGNVYSCVMLDKIKSITSHDLSTGATETVSEDAYFYNPDTTEIKFNVRPKEEQVFSVVAVYPETVKFNLTGIKDDRFIFMKDGRVVSPSEYKYDSSSKILEVTGDFNLEDDSYELFWELNMGSSSIGNKLEKYEKEYHELTMKWLLDGNISL